MPRRSASTPHLIAGVKSSGMPKAVAEVAGSRVGDALTVTRSSVPEARGGGAICNNSGGGPSTENARGVPEFTFHDESAKTSSRSSVRHIVE